MEPNDSLLAALLVHAPDLLLPYLEPVRLDYGIVLAEPTQELRYVYFPRSCIVSATCAMNDGSNAEVAAIGREGLVGLAALLGGRNALMRYVVQIGGCAFRLERHRLEAALEEVPAARALCLRYVQAFLGQVIQLVACSTYHPVEARLSRRLLMLHDRIGSDKLPLTHDAMAESLGVRRATVTLAAQKLQAVDLIRCRRGSFQILNRDRLKATCCECYQAISVYYADVRLTS